MIAIILFIIFYLPRVMVNTSKLNMYENITKPYLLLYKVANQQTLWVYAKRMLKEVLGLRKGM